MYISFAVHKKSELSWLNSLRFKRPFSVIWFLFVCIGQCFLKKNYHLDFFMGIYGPSSHIGWTYGLILQFYLCRICHLVQRSLGNYFWTIQWHCWSGKYILIYATSGVSTDSFDCLEEYLIFRKLCWLFMMLHWSFQESHDCVLLYNLLA